MNMLKPLLLLVKYQVYPILALIHIDDITTYNIRIYIYIYIYMWLCIYIYIYMYLYVIYQITSVIGYIYIYYIQLIISNYIPISLNISPDISYLQRKKCVYNHDPMISPSDPVEAWKDRYACGVFLQAPNGQALAELERPVSCFYWPWRISVYMYICIYMYVYIYVYIYIYTTYHN